MPSDPAARDERCAEAYNIQVHGLTKRLASTGDATRTNARRLMDALGVTGAGIDIKPSCLQMLRDLGHPFAQGQQVFDVTFENVQAGERTSHLFRLANYHDALVVGTGDLSELALGWCTYGVGDQMSHYSVNASVPKTLIQHLIRWVIVSKQFDEHANDAFEAILETKISRSSFLAHHAWGNRARGRWPEDLHEDRRREYSLTEIERWLDVFIRRFYALSQFKRSCLPNGPKVGSGGSLSPRSDWRAPADAEADV